MDKKFFTIKQAAELLGVTPLTLRNWDKRGVLSAHRHPVNNYRLYRASDIEDLLSQMEQPKERPPKEPAAAPIPEPIAATANTPPKIQKLSVRFEEEI